MLAAVQALTNKTIDGSLNTLLNLPAAQLTGSIADARLSGNVDLLNAAQTFTARKTFPAAGANAAQIPAILGGAANTNGHTVPNLADDVFALLAAAQTLTNKTINGSNNTLTNLPAAQLTGTIADARLSSNVALLTGAQTLLDKLLSFSGSATSVYKALEIPAGTYKLRLYTRGDAGFFFTINASTSDASTWTKDDTSAPSVVLLLTNSSGFVNWRVMYESSGSSSWTNPTRSLRWNGVSAVIQTTTGTAQMSAWAGGFVKNCTAGDTLRFPVQWPIVFEAAPTNISFGTVNSSNVTLASLAMTSGTVDVTGGQVQVTVTANGDAYWIGKISVGS